MKYLLDTNVCVSLLRENSPKIEARVMSELRANSQFSLSSVSVFELWYGVGKSSKREWNGRKLTAFLANWIDRLAFDDEDARVAGEIRVDLETVGQRIGEYDLLIAGQALRHKMTLVTANVREFARVKDLLLEDWSKGSSNQIEP